MIYGVIPAGGKGTRLGLPFPKELLPQKGFDFYNPTVNHIINKMKEAGAEQLYFIHDPEYKQSLKDYLNDPLYIHVRQKVSGVANILLDFYNSVELQDSDQVLFGMADTVFEGNPFTSMCRQPGIVCAMFHTTDDAKVDRLTVKTNKFDVKSIKTDTNSATAWGVLKFDGASLRKFVEDDVFSQCSNIGDVLNQYPVQLVSCGEYIDLGTWAGYNRYLSNFNFK